MKLDAKTRVLDQAERARQSAFGGRRQSETSFLQRLLRELGDDRFADLLSPAGLYRAALNDQQFMQLAREVLEVLGLPSQRLKDDLRAGDWILRAVPGTGDVGHISVLASDDLLSPAALSSEGIGSEGVRPGYYGLVIEAGAYPHSRSRPFARRVLDSRGCVPPYTLLLRPRYPEIGALSDFPPHEPDTNHGYEARNVDEVYAYVDEAGPWISGDDPYAEEDVKAAVSIATIQFAFSGNTDVHAMYLAANTHPALPGVSLDWWARGPKITDPEWQPGRSDKENKCAVVTRNKPVKMRVTLKCSTSVDVGGTLTASPTLDGSNKYLKDVSVAFTYPSGATSHTVDIELGSTMPDEVGRFQLKVKWTATGTGISFSNITTTHCIYSAYGRPLEPDYDSPSIADTGTFTSVADGTLTGTRKRLDKLTELLGSTRRMPAKTTDELIELLWKLHVGINDTPGAPPYFDAAHDRFLTVNGEGSGAKIPIDDQWLAWLVTNSPNWNDASCIGHVQLLKTMAAAIGIFVRRTWVYPTTKILPDKSTPTIADTDCYSLGTEDSTKTQKWNFTLGSRTLEAEPKLMEPGLAYENFEACMLTSQGRFLTGGYATSSNPKSFTTDRGFKSAKDLLRWWCNTKRPSFGKRFMAWVYNNRLTGEAHLWDVDGKHYAPSDYVKIRDTGKELPPP